MGYETVLPREKSFVKLGMCGRLALRDCGVLSRRCRHLEVGLGLCRGSGPKDTLCLEPSQRSLCASQPAGPALLDAVFPAPSTFLQEAPLLAQLDDAFPLTPWIPHPQPKGEPNRRACQCGHSTWLAFLQPGPKPQTQEKPDLAQLASAGASCPSVCGWASC